MTRSILFIALFFLCSSSTAQVKELPITGSEQNLENITANNDGLETEDDSYLQEMEHFIKDPLNLNNAEEEELNELKILTALQVRSLVAYRNLLGKLLDLYELQAVPGWDLQTIRKIRPFVILTNPVRLLENLKQRIRGGEHSLMFRVSQTLERSAGYGVDPSSGKNYYMGSPQKLLLRYKYAYKNLLQFGILAEKDAGEQFFKGSQKQGFDFYSAHLFIRNLGMIRSIALGDFTVNLGQGLIQWQSLAFKKGPDIISAIRQSAVLRPYNSSGEINFHRGLGITVGKRNWEASVFVSYRKQDANFVPSDSLNSEELITSLQQSGYHRTRSEMDDRHIQSQFTYGGNIAFKFRQLHIGINGIQYQFKYPLEKDDQPYNTFALSGKSSGNYSIDYRYTYRNMHFFGEAAITDKKAPAIIQGLLISVSKNADMSLVYRNISSHYHALYASAFTENTDPANEKGVFTGISIRPTASWQVDAFADIYQFPWLKYRVDAPSGGSDYFIQVAYRPNKLLEIYSRYRKELKGINESNGQFVLSPVIYQPKQNWRLQFSYKINQQFTCRGRVEMSWFDKKGQANSTGFLVYFDLLYKPMLKPLAANLRLQYFETEDYNSRLYAYENDILYSYSIPVFDGKGYRYYLNVIYNISRKLEAWFRFAQTIYPGKNSIGTGLDEIKGNHKTELKLQIIYIF